MEKSEKENLKNFEELLEIKDDSLIEKEIEKIIEELLKQF